MTKLQLILALTKMRTMAEGTSQVRIHIGNHLYDIDHIDTVIDRSHVRMLRRNLCYTAVSRAQERLILIGDEAAIQEGLKVQEEKERDTELCEMLLDKSTES